MILKVNLLIGMLWLLFNTIISKSVQNITDASPTDFNWIKDVFSMRYTEIQKCRISLDLLGCPNDSFLMQRLSSIKVALLSHMWKLRDGS